MISKADLRRYKYIKSEIKQFQEQIAELQSLMTAPKTSRFTPSSGGSHGDSDKIGQTIIRLERLEDRYCQKIAELVELQTAIENAIGKLKPEEETIIRLYYYNGLTWEKVCEKTGYSWRQIHRKHKSALLKLAQDGV